jgi:hypothetical protein
VCVVWVSWCEHPNLNHGFRSYLVSRGVVLALASEIGCLSGELVSKSSYLRERLLTNRRPRKNPTNKAPANLVFSSIGMNRVSSLVISTTPKGLAATAPPPHPPAIPSSICCLASFFFSGLEQVQKAYATLPTGMTVFPSATIGSPYIVLTLALVWRRSAIE